MKIGTNNLHQIVQINAITDPSLITHEIDREHVFGGWSDARILAYCYEPREYGYAIYPYKDLDMLDATEPLMTVNSIVFVTLAQGGMIDAITAAEHADLFIAWSTGYTCIAGTIVRDAGKLYRALHDVDAGQAHRKPSETITLWTPIADPAEEWPAWSAPLGAHDAYDIGAKVTYNGKHWVNEIQGNAYTPGVAGWREVVGAEAEPEPDPEPDPEPVDEWPAWKQPQGTEGAYKLGDKVSHKDKHWICTQVNGGINAYEPGVWGWTAQV